MAIQWKLIIFVVVSIGFVCRSWRSLGNVRSHGFYRFFAFETILVLVLLNLDYWFDEPFSLRQIISWFLLLISIYWVTHGALLLWVAGKPDRKRDDEALVGLEKTTKLVMVGAYRFIRHPLYSSLFFGAWGIFFKYPSWIGISLVVITTFFAIVTAKMEEAENIRYFGAAYKSYMKKTRMLVPFLF